MTPGDYTGNERRRGGPDRRDPNARVKIILVDDHALFRVGMRQILDAESDFEVVAEADDSRSAIDAAGAHTPDIVLLDLSLPPPGGIETTQRVKREAPSAGIVALAATEDEDQLFDAIKAGAAAFLLKDIGPEDLVTIIRRVNTGEYLINDKVFARPSVANRVLKEFRELAVYGQEAAPIFAPLSPREVEILDNIAKGMTNKQVAYALSISEQTVKNHMSSILRKLSVNDRTQAVVYAMKQGWIRIPRGLSTSEPSRAPEQPPATPTPASGPAPAAGQPTPPGDPHVSAASPPGAPVRPQGGVAPLRSELEEDSGRIESEISEIDVLMEQVLIETERHEARRAKLAVHLESLERMSAPDPEELAEARADLISITRRELLFDAQRQVLEGKQRILARFLQRLVDIDDSLAAMDGGVKERPVREASQGPRPLAEAGRGSGAPGITQSALQMRSEEDLRRDIVRQLHDGPAQSLANIGLQAEIVERLVNKRDERANAELQALQRLVQQALDTTKEFIFEIRPMVLDDLGLGPTIRRTCADRSRRFEIPVEFDSQGIERRLPSDLESAFFRSINEAMAGFISLRPPSILVRLDWSDRELLAVVEGTWPRSHGEGSAEAADTGGSVPRPGETPAFLLAMMQERGSAEREALTASRSLAPERVEVMQERAAALGMTFAMRDGGQVMELAAAIPR